MKSNSIMEIQRLCGVVGFSSSMVFLRFLWDGNWVFIGTMGVGIGLKIEMVKGPSNSFEAEIGG